MKKVLRVIACSLVISMLFSCAAFAKPVHTSIFGEKYLGDTAMNIVSQINKTIQNQHKNLELPYMSNFNLIDDGSFAENTYLGCWGESSVIIKEDAATNKVKYISVSVPRNSAKEEQDYFLLQTSYLKHVFEIANDVSAKDCETAFNKMNDCLGSATSCSCWVGKLHYEVLFGDNVVLVNYSAIVDDGTK